MNFRPFTEQSQLCCVQKVDLFILFMKPNNSRVSANTGDVMVTWFAQYANLVTS